MREIKFRAFDNYSKEMIYYGFSIPNDGWRRINGDKNFDLEIMQYTGLKDKNGKEIYEGDIVTQHLLRTTRLGEVNSEIIYNQDECSYQIATLSDDGEERYLSPIDKLVEIEVIGNIYENPDLLTNL